MQTKNQYHIITVGNSLFDNYKRDYKLESISNIEEDLFYRYMLSKNKKASAEINSFVTFIESHKIDPALCSIYFIGTDSEENKKILKLQIRYFKEQIKVKEITGTKIIPPATASSEESIKGIQDLLDSELKQVFKRQKEGFEVFFCASGGYKPHVIFTAIAGYLSKCQIYYINEKSDSLIVFPPLLLSLSPQEIDIIRKIYNREDFHIVINESQENINWFLKNKDIIEKLENFYFLNIIRDKTNNEPVKIFLPDKTKLYIERYLKQ